MFQKVERFFRFDALNTSFKKEIIGGLTTFLAMIYILSIQPSMLSAAPSINNPTTQHMSFGGIFVATAIVSIIATTIMAFSANMPVALAPSMGLNAVFTYNVAQAGIGYEGALIAVMLSAVVFTLVSATKLRKIIISSIPNSMKLAIGSGIGFFIAYIGCKDIGLIEVNDNGLPVASLSHLQTFWPLILLGILVLVIIFILDFKKVPGSVAIAIMIGLIISLIVGNLSKDEFIQKNFSHWTGWSYADFNGWTINLKNTYQAFANPKIWTSPTMYIAIFIFLLVSFFDATGTLYSISHQISTLSQQNYQLSRRALIADSVGTLTGSIIGSSPVTTFVESTTGVSQGARTGFSSLVTAFLFLLAIGLYPIFKLITQPICGAALIFVGTLMVKQIKDIEWINPTICVSSFLTILFMITTYSITNGIGVGFLSYSLISLINKKYHDIHVITYFLDVVFISYFIAYSFIQ